MEQIAGTMTAKGQYTTYRVTAEHEGVTYIMYQVRTPTSMVYLDCTHNTRSAIAYMFQRAYEGKDNA